MVYFKVKDKILSLIGKYQHGFYPERNCHTAIKELLTWIQSSKSRRMKQYILFIDLRKAFDSIDRNKLWNWLKSELILSEHDLNYLCTLL